jgi:hypothetical protein
VEEGTPETVEEFPLKKYFNGLQKGANMVKNFNFRAFFEGIFTFVSIIGTPLAIQPHT